MSLLLSAATQCGRGAFFDQFVEVGLLEPWESAKPVTLELSPISRFVNEAFGAEGVCGGGATIDPRRGLPGEFIAQGFEDDSGIHWQGVRVDHGLARVKRMAALMMSEVEPPAACKARRTAALGVKVIHLGITARTKIFCRRDFFALLIRFFMYYTMVIPLAGPMPFRV